MSERVDKILLAGQLHVNGHKRHSALATRDQIQF